MNGVHQLTWPIRSTLEASYSSLAIINGHRKPIMMIVSHHHYQTDKKKNEEESAEVGEAEAEEEEEVEGAEEAERLRSDPFGTGEEHHQQVSYRKKKRYTEKVILLFGMFKYVWPLYCSVYVWLTDYVTVWYTNVGNHGQQQVVADDNSSIS